jgi:5-methyltetrahydrofolate--homocysteine methyltransferase
LFEYLNAAEIGMKVTESMAMIPASSVSGFYFSHPQSEYFNVGRIGEDQLADIASRSGRTDDEMRSALASSLG